MANENLRSTINTIDDAVHEDVSTSNDQQENQDDSKLSEQEMSEMVSEGKLTEKRLIKVVENTAPPVVRSQIIDQESTIDRGRAQPCATPAINSTHLTRITSGNASSSINERKHVMISYNRATATPICQKIYDHLTLDNRYKVWFDRRNLTYGSIIDAMGDAVDNAYVVLLCINEGYSKSNYCLKEAKYAVESKVQIIPCMMEEQFRPRGGLGLIKSDLKHIEFYDENKFDESFEELTIEIDAIASGSQTASLSTDNTNFRERFLAILNEHIQSMQKCHLDRNNLNEPELRTLLQRFIQEFSPETWQSFQTDPSNQIPNRQVQQGDNDRLIEHVFVTNQRLAEMVRVQQENRTWIEQHLLEQDERLRAFQRFQQRQEQERLLPRSHVEEMQRRDDERNDRLIRRLEQQIEQLTNLIINQQEQHAREMNQLVHQSLDASANAQQQRTSQFNLDLLKNVIHMIVLLCTMLALFKN